MKALDLYCGLGGWSDGLVMEGFEILGVEINPEIAELYNHPVIVADVRDLDGKDFQGYDLIVGSPPCRDFTQLPNHAMRSDVGYWSWKEPKNPERGMTMINALLRIVEEAKPRYWLMENVVGLTEYLDMKPRQITRLTRGKRRAFWGNYPTFLVPRDYTHFMHHQKYSGKYRAWERARIPIPVAQALGRAVREACS